MPWPAMTDYQEAIQNPQMCFADHELQCGIPVVDKLGLPKPVTGSFASVYQMNCQGRKYAVRCFLKYHHDQEKRYGIISRYLRLMNSPYMVRFEFLKKGIKVRNKWYPILKMEWVDGEPLDIFLARNIDNIKVLRDTAEGFLHLNRTLQSRGIAHGDLQHGNLLLVKGDFHLIDYDGMYVPGMEKMISLELGHPNYQHPAREERDFGPYLDYYSSWVIYLSLLALSVDRNMRTRFMARCGEEFLLIRKEDFSNPDTSLVFRALCNSSDEEVRKVTALLMKMTRGADLKQMLPLKGQADAMGIGRENATALPGWLAGNFEPVKNPKSVVEVEPIAPKGSRLPERCLLGLFTVSGMTVVFAGVSGMIRPVNAAASLSAGMLLLGILLVAGFRCCPPVLQKHKQKQILDKMRKEINQIETEIERVKAWKEKIVREAETRANALKCQLQELEQEKVVSLNKADGRLAEMLAGINRRRQAILHNDQGAFEKACRHIQQELQEKALLQYDMASAAIPGVGPKTKRLLVDSGIQTAADIVDIRISKTGWGPTARDKVYIETKEKSIYLEGIGALKANRLLKWKQAMEVRVVIDHPPVLQDVLQALEAKQNEAIKTNEKEKCSIRTKFKHQQQILQTELQEVSNATNQELLTLELNLHQQQDKLAARQAAQETIQKGLSEGPRTTFSAYLKQILF